MVAAQQQVVVEEEEEAWAVEEEKAGLQQDLEGRVCALNAVIPHLTHLVYLAISRPVLNAEPQ